MDQTPFRDTDEAIDNIDELARNFGDALVAASEISGQPELGYQPDEQLTQRFCNDVVRYLDLRAARSLAVQDREAGQGEQVTEELAGRRPAAGYVDFLETVLGYLARAASDIGVR